MEMRLYTAVIIIVFTKSQKGPRKPYSTPHVIQICNYVLPHCFRVCLLNAVKFENFI